MHWVTAFVVLSVLFVCVYRFSGLAEFQTGRFVALGDSTLEILLSPLMNAREFWGQLLQPKKFGFVASLLIPCFIPAFRRGWMLASAIALPLLVLLVWDHQPATCIAFHYSSTLLPVIWMAALLGARRLPPGSAGVGALATALTLSIYIGQFPWSAPNNLGMLASSYGSEVDARAPHTPAGTWLAEQIALVRSDGSAVLASRRIAGHLIGNQDVETVQQYLERRPDLAELSDRNGNPIAHYKWILLDRREVYQGAVDQVQQVMDEAQSQGFRMVTEHDGLVLLQRSD